MCRNWGYENFAKKKHDESIGEMKDADELIERILFLDGVPNVQRLDPVRVGEDPIEQHRLDLEMEKEAVKRLNDAIRLCHDKKDAGNASCWSTSWRARRRGWTGSRRSCTWWRRWGSSSTSRSRSA